MNKNDYKFCFGSGKNLLQDSAPQTRSML